MLSEINNNEQSMDINSLFNVLKKALSAQNHMVIYLLLITLIKMIEEDELALKVNINTLV